MNEKRCTQAAWTGLDRRSDRIISASVAGLLTLLAACSPAVTPDPPAVDPPASRQQEVVDIVHGEAIADPYRWLEDQDSAETRSWIDAQNAYTVSQLGNLPARRTLGTRIEALMRIDRVAAPIERAGRFFVWKKRAEDDLWILHLRRGLDAEDEVLIDPHSLSEDHTTGVSIGDISRDGTLLAFEVRQGGLDETEVRFLDVDRRQELVDRLPAALYSSIEIAPDKQGVYYGRQDREIGNRIFYHPLGADPAEDQQIFGDGYGPGQWVAADLSPSGRYLLFVVAHGWSQTELFVRDLSSDDTVHPLASVPGASFEPAFAGDRLFVQTDWQAPTGRVMEIDLGSPQPEHWREVVPTGEDAIQGFSLVGGQLFVKTLHNVTSRIARFDLEGNHLGDLALPGPGTAATPGGSWDSTSAFFGFESFTSPAVLLRYDIERATTDVWARDSVPFDPQGYATEQVWYRSKDGTEIPMFVVSRNGLEENGQQPTLLYGYGGFNASITPRFRTLWALWLEHGGVLAVANIRGGGEFGDAWHRAGMLGNKQNVFDDFNAAAEWLVDNGIASPERLAIQGRSNGGLLVGAALTQRPELYQAVLCEYPDLDMIRYHQFDNNNPPALLEYGDASKPEHFAFLREYSPYQRVRDGVAYPAVMLTTGDADSRVPPLQARKMTARLQGATASENPVYLLYDGKGGHAGSKPLAKVVDELALQAAFLFSQLGVDAE